VPLAVGFAVALAVLFFNFPQKRFASMIVFSVAGVFVSSLLGTSIAFNLYGTQASHVGWQVGAW
jgi:hypothetical protein